MIGEFMWIPMVADNLFARMACADCVDVSANWSAARWGPDPGLATSTFLIIA